MLAGEEPSPPVLVIVPYTLYLLEGLRRLRMPPTSEASPKSRPARDAASDVPGTLQPHPDWLFALPSDVWVEASAPVDVPPEELELLAALSPPDDPLLEPLVVPELLAVAPELLDAPELLERPPELEDPELPVAPELLEELLPLDELASATPASPPPEPPVSQGVGSGAAPLFVNFIAYASAV
jgi:hypothetical protein